MDVAKYIGLFLIKNQSCFIQGLGNLELKRVPAYYDGKNLHSPSTEVTLASVGPVDDSLANFIATNEKISTSKALNAIREFSIRSKTDIQAGKDIHIPFIGKFTDNDGKIVFVTDTKLRYTPTPIPAVRTISHVDEIPVPQHQQQEQQLLQDNSDQYQTPLPPPVDTTENSQQEEEEKRGINWGRIIFYISILFVIVVGVMYLYDIYQENMAMDSHSSSQQPIVLPDTQTHVQPIQVHDTAKIDSAAHDTTTKVKGPEIPGSSSIAAPSPGVKPMGPKLYQYDVVLKSFYTSEKAQKELSSMKQHGLGVRLVVVDSLNYLMVMHIKTSRSDTDRVIDSIDKLYPGAYLR